MMLIGRTGAFLSGTQFTEYLADTFTDTNGTALASHTMDTGSGWTADVGTWTISSNTAVQSSTLATVTQIATADAGVSDAVAWLRVKTSAGAGRHQAGMVFRYSDTNNYFLVYYNLDTNIVGLGKIEGGAFTLLDSKAHPDRYQLYMDFEVRCSGTAITVTLDGGYTLSATSSFNSTATKFGMHEYRSPDAGGSGWLANVFDSFQVVSYPTYTWTRQGTVLSATVPAESDTVLEPNVILESNAQVLTGTVYKMWYTQDWGSGTQDIGYAESADGSTWTKYGSNPILTSLARLSLLLSGGTYYLYVSDDLDVDLYTSSDGLSFSLDTAGVLARGSGGSWDDTSIANVHVWKESDSDWRMMYEARGSTGTWKIGYATSTNGTSWTKSGSNPVLNEDGSTGGPFVYKVGGYYYLFVHKAPQSGFAPTTIHRYRSTDLTSWTPWPRACIFPRSGSDEGEDTYIGQNADVFIIQVDGSVKLYFSANSDAFNQSGLTHIELATSTPGAIDGW